MPGEAPPVLLAGRPVFASFAIGAAVLLIQMLQPVLLGALAAEGRLDESSLGRVAAAELFGLAIGTGFGPPLMTTRGMRLRIAAAMAMLVLANLVTPGAQTAGALLLLRSAAGLLEGLVLGACIAVQVRTAAPERVNALFFGLVGMPQIIAGYWLPTLILPRHGADGGFLLVGTLTLAAALAAAAMPSSLKTDGDDVPRPTPWNLLTLLLVFAVVVQNAGNSGAWTYVERIASQREFAPSTVGLAVSAGVAANVLASLAVAGVGWRLPALRVLMIGMPLQALVAIHLGGTGDPWGYVGAAIGYNIFWAGLLPFYIAIAVRIDPSRVVAQMLAGAGLLGLAVGPALTSLAVQPGDVSPAFAVTAALLFSASLLYAVIAAGIRRQR